MDSTIYYINLDRRTDRRIHIEDELSRAGWTANRYTADDQSPGWVGCRDSHLNLMDIAIKTNNIFMVLEDDCVFVNDVAEKMMDCINELPNDWDMLYLGASPKEPQVRYSQHLFRVSKAHVTHAILWRNRRGGAIDYILSHRDHIRKIDDYFAEEIQPRFNCFLAWPMLATQIQTQSDTCKRSDVSTIKTNYNNFCR